MATVTIRYWAAAKDAAGVAEEVIEAETLGEALDQVVTGRDGADRLRAVLAGSSFLVDGSPATWRVASGLALPEHAVVEVLPQFAGGLAENAQDGCAARPVLRHTGGIYPRVSASARCGVLRL